MQFPACFKICFKHKENHQKDDKIEIDRDSMNDIADDEMRDQQNSIGPSWVQTECSPVFNGRKSGGIAGE